MVKIAMPYAGTMAITEISRLVSRLPSEEQRKSDRRFILSVVRDSIIVNVRTVTMPYLDALAVRARLGVFTRRRGRGADIARVLAILGECGHRRTQARGLDAIAVRFALDVLARLAAR